MMEVSNDVNARAARSSGKMHRSSIVVGKVGWLERSRAVVPVFYQFSLSMLCQILLNWLLASVSESPVITFSVTLARIPTCSQPLHVHCAASPPGIAPSGRQTAQKGPSLPMTRWRNYDSSRLSYLLHASFDTSTCASCTSILAQPSARLRKPLLDRFPYVRTRRGVGVIVHSLVLV